VVRETHSCFQRRLPREWMLDGSRGIAQSGKKPRTCTRRSSLPNRHVVEPSSGSEEPRGYQTGTSVRARRRAGAREGAPVVNVGAESALITVTRSPSTPAMPPRRWIAPRRSPFRARLAPSDLATEAARRRWPRARDGPQRRALGPPGPRGVEHDQAHRAEIDAVQQRCPGFARQAEMATERVTVVVVPGQYIDGDHQLRHELRQLLVLGVSRVVGQVAGNQDRRTASAPGRSFSTDASVALSPATGSRPPHVAPMCGSVSWASRNGLSMARAGRAPAGPGI
jgi:hypothetical protein